MTTHTRRAVLGFAGGAVATASMGALGAGFIEIADAMPIAPDPGKIGTEIGTSSPLVTQVQSGPRPPGSGRPPATGGGRRPPPRRRPPPVRRRRRWVCWWHRGRRRCGWRW